MLALLTLATFGYTRDSGQPIHAGDRIQLGPTRAPSGAPQGWKPGAPVQSPSEGIFKGVPTGRENVPSTNRQFEQDVFHMVNLERRAHGLREVVWSEDLARAARYHAADMIADQYFDHDTKDRVLSRGQLRLRSVARAKDRVHRFFFEYNGENIAWGQRTPAEVMQWWMNAPGHRENILRRDTRFLGVGYVQGVWVQDFGR